MAPWCASTYQSFNKGFWEYVMSWTQLWYVQKKNDMSTVLIWYVQTNMICPHQQYDMSFTLFLVYWRLFQWNNWRIFWCLLYKLAILLHIFSTVALELFLWENETVFLTLLKSGHIIPNGHIIVQLWVDELAFTLIRQPMWSPPI